ncbi:monovalent cation/H+ antiporter subunit D family protein [Wenzhouxiangella limi]|uniref:Monovalent cation/H+ antiporter subunit D family protein n=1 Tax=Wenzhouxiangella limi TaxID=2707351 RepID=A0A845UVU7_9GAMM|nr:monovalent cation/H+ antiporter subunit D family protein [Wenzhouxiangella limi]NDY95953.1 monovalent cation/H+ antiporter subunit D family protein [Wenzhouxiangella limi]
MTLLDLMPFMMLAPLIGSGFVAVLPGRATPWAVTMLVCLSSAIIAAAVLAETLGGATMSYPFGNWPPPIGIEYRVDAANAFVAFLVAAMAAVTLLWAPKSVAVEIQGRHGTFYALFLLVVAGLLGITLTGDAFNVFVFLEISSLASYALIAYGQDRRALLAAFRYLIMGTVGATFFLIGIAFLYMVTGTLNMADLAERLPAMSDNNAVRAALAFIVVGMGLKLALLPLHLWLPNAYAYAPNFVTVFLAGTATKVALYVMLRFAFTVFGPDYSFVVLPLSTVLMVLALAGMFAGSWVAMFQIHLKRMLAYSSVAQVGYMVLGVSLATLTGLTAAFLHLFNHALIKTALFMAVGCVIYRTGSARLDDLRGLGRQMPWTLTAFALAGLSIIGVPTTVGFISKWYLVLASIEAGAWWLVVFLVITSLMALYYIWRVIEAAWFSPRPNGAAEMREAPLALLIPTWFVVSLNFYFGLDTRLTVGAARAAAGALLGDGGSAP